MNYFSIHHLPTASFILWSLFFCSVVLFSVILERCWFWLADRSRLNGRLVTQLTQTASISLDELKEFSMHFEHPITNALKTINTLNASTVFLQVKMLSEKEVLRSEFGVRVMGAIYALAPMFGILGTVTGIIRSFEVFSRDALSPEMIMPGISEALITTAVGLILAVPALIAHQIFSSLSDRSAFRLEQFLFVLERQVKAVDRKETHSANIEAV